MNNRMFHGKRKNKDQLDTEFIAVGSVALTKPWKTRRCENDPQLSLLSFSRLVLCDQTARPKKERHGITIHVPEEMGEGSIQSQSFSRREKGSFFLFKVCWRWSKVSRTFSCWTLRTMRK